MRDFNLTDDDIETIIESLIDHQKWYDKDENQYKDIEEVLNKLYK